MNSVPFSFYEHLVEHVHRSAFATDYGFNEKTPLDKISKLSHKAVRSLTRKFEKNCFNLCLGLCGENGVRDISVHQDYDGWSDPTGQDPLEALNDMRNRITQLHIGYSFCSCCEAFRKKASDGEDEEEDDDYWDEDSKEPVVQMTPKQLDEVVHKLKCFRYYDNIGIDLNSDVSVDLLERLEGCVSARELEVLGDGKEHKHFTRFLEGIVKTGDLRKLHLRENHHDSIIAVLVDLIGQKQLKRLEQLNQERNDNSFGSRLLNSLLDAWRAQEEPDWNFDLQLQTIDVDVGDDWNWSNLVEKISRYVTEMHPNGKASVKIDDVNKEDYYSLLNIYFRTNDDVQEAKSDYSGSESSPKEDLLRGLKLHRNYMIKVLTPKM